MNLLHPHKKRDEERKSLEELATQDTPDHVIRDAAFGYMLRYGNDKWLKQYEDQTYNKPK